MLSLRLRCNSDASIVVLCFGAHSDDIEIGCGGTILRLLAEYPRCVFHWVVFSAIDVREGEARCGAERFVGSARLQSLMLNNFPDGFMPYVGGEVKAAFEQLKATVSPDIVFCPNRKDAHQDHRLVAELTWNTFRDHLILEYEIPKYDGDIGQPNMFVPLDVELCEQKIAYLLDTFHSQRSKGWFQRETFLALMRLRGMECNAPTGYAEAFYCRKMVI